MALVYRSGPVEEPVSLAEAKAHLRLETATDDAIVASLIVTSRLHIEAALGLATTSQDWTLVLDRWPKGGEVKLPMRPVAAVTGLRVLGADGTPQTVSPDHYILDGQGLPPRLVAAGGTWPVPGRPAHGIEIDFTAGFGPSASDVPGPLRQAILLLVAHWYEHREPIEIGSPETAIPGPVCELLKPFAVVRI